MVSESSDSSSSESSDSESDIEDKRPTKKLCTSPTPSALSYIPETPDNRTHLAGSTPAVLGTYFSSGSSSGVTPNTPNKGTQASSTMDVTLPLSNAATGPIIAPTSLVRDEIQDILENYSDFAFEDEETAPMSPSSSNAPTGPPETFDDALNLSTSHSMSYGHFEDPLPLETPPPSWIPSAPSTIPTITNTSPTMDLPRVPSVTTIPDTFASLSPARAPSSPITTVTPPQLSRPQTPSIQAAVPANGLPSALVTRQGRPLPPAPRPAPTAQVTNANLDNSFMATQDDNLALVGVRKIPGPAGQLPPIKNAAQLHGLVQAAKESEIAARASQAPVSLSRSANAQKLEDQADFRNGAWMQMLCDQDMLPYGANKLGTSLDWVRRVGWQKGVPSIIVYVKALRLIEDDYRAVLRDPTGAFENSTVSKAVLEKFVDFSSGCVVMLKDVPVFTPSKGKNYLVLNPENIVRVWPRTDMTRQELSHLSCRVYTYNCIYEQTALPLSARTSLPPIPAASHHHAGRAASQMHRIQPTAIYHDPKGTGAPTHASMRASSSAQHNPFNGLPSIPGMTNHSEYDT